MLFCTGSCKDISTKIQLPNEVFFLSFLFFFFFLNFPIFSTCILFPMVTKPNISVSKKHVADRENPKFKFLQLTATCFVCVCVCV